jgi:hypothetical protein
MNHVSGTLRFGPQKAQMTHLYSRQKANDDGAVLALMFSNVPLPLRMLDDRQKLMQLAHKGEFLGLYAELTADGTLQQSELVHGDGALFGSWQFEAPKGKATTHEGRIATDGESDFFGKAVVVDLNFKVAGTPTADWSGSPLYELTPSGLPLGGVDGWMERAGKRTALTHAMVLVQTNLFAPAGDQSVLLTTQPVTDEMLTARMGPEQALNAAGATVLRVRVDPKGEIQSITAPTEDGRVMTFSSNQWDAELSSPAPGELEGRLESSRESRTMSEHPAFQVRFRATMKTVGPAAPVTAESGKSLPAGGGEPGKSYHAFLEALKSAGSLEELIPLRSMAHAAKLESVPPQHRPRMLSFLREQAQTPLQIVGGFGHETQATLWLEGRKDGERMAGRVNVHRENGVWKLGAEAYRIGNVSEN